jgi:predicted AAA+ superfamily ATPase
MKKISKITKRIRKVCGEMKKEIQKQLIKLLSRSIGYGRSGQKIKRNTIKSIMSKINYLKYVLS